jgi:hypothetical protein
VDVEQIMRDIRSRIAKRHGIDLTPQQIHELAARRLEAILEPRHVSPSLLEQMRRAAGQPVDVPAPAVEAAPELDEAALYASHRGLLHRLRRWLNPVLKLFFNPAPLVTALRDQVRRSNAAASREAELHARQAEWNALHFEILQRLVTEVSRATLDVQGLTTRVESLAAKVDFNERRVRGLEGAAVSVPSRPMGRAVESSSAETARPAPGGSAESATPGTPQEGGPDAPRRRRRRRRGRRGPGPVVMDASTGVAGLAPVAASEAEADVDVEGDDGDTDLDSDVEGDEPTTTPSAGPSAVSSLQAPVSETVEGLPHVQPAQADITTEPGPPAEPFTATLPVPDAPAPSTPVRDEPLVAPPLDPANGERQE